MNEHIVNSPYVLFLGAGASQPLGCHPTARFLKLLESQLPDHIRQAEGNTLRPPDLGTLFEQAAQHYGVSPPDSEIVLDYLDYLTAACKQLFNIPKRFRSLVGSGISHEYHSEWADMLSRLRGYIEEVVIEHYSFVDSTQALDLYRPLMDKVLSNHRVLPIFTTNYDWTFERLVSVAPDDFDLVDGFKTTPNGQRWSRDVFANFTPDMKKSHLVLFKLHGSTSWSWVDRETVEIEKVTGASPQQARPRAVIYYPSQAKKAATQ